MLELVKIVIPEFPSRMNALTGLNLREHILPQCCFWIKTGSRAKMFENCIILFQCVLHYAPEC